MGMFDTVHARCPNCGASITTQSKAGVCLLNDYSAENLPAVIAADVEGERMHCEVCDGTFTLTTDILGLARARMFLSTEGDSDMMENFGSHPVDRFINYRLKDHEIITVRTLYDMYADRDATALDALLQTVREVVEAEGEERGYEAAEYCSRY